MDVINYPYDTMSLSLFVKWPYGLLIVFVHDQ